MDEMRQGPKSEARWVKKAGPEVIPHRPEDYSRVGEGLDPMHHSAKLTYSIKMSCKVSSGLVKLEERWSKCHSNVEWGA